jgi:hypothetical protein
VALLASATRGPLDGDGVFVPFGGGVHDWSALEVASWLALGIVGIDVEPLLAAPTPDGLLAVVEPASIVVVGMSLRWRQEGFGSVRQALVEHASPPTLVVHSGPRPSGLAPRESRTRFTWSIEATA